MNGVTANSTLASVLRGVIFDLDGVLLDSRKNMEKSWKAIPLTLKRAVPFELFLETVGLPFDAAMKQLGLEAEAQEIENRFRSNSLRYIDLLSPFPGVSPMLQRLREFGVSLTLFTSKDCERTESIVQKFGWTFDTVLCPRPGILGKPSGIQLLTFMAQNSTQPVDYVYFGDSCHDYCAAVEAGVAYRHCSWGVGQRPRGLNPSEQIDSIAAILHTVLQWNPPSPARLG